MRFTLTVHPAVEKILSDGDQSLRRADTKKSAAAARQAQGSTKAISK